jgi:hypothetical protein
MKLVWQLVGTLLLVGFVLKYWWLMLAVTAAVLVWKFGLPAYRAHLARLGAVSQVKADIAARADRQHQWVMQGNDRGMYGAAWADVQKYESQARR